MFKKSLIFTIALFIALATPVFANGKINTKYGIFKATIDTSEYVAKLTLAGKKVGDLEADNINVDKVYSIGKSQLVVLSSELGNGGNRGYHFVAIFPNKKVKIFNGLVESREAKYQVKNGNFIATYDEQIVTFNGTSFHQSKRTNKSKFKGDNIPDAICKLLYKNLDSYDPNNSLAQYQIHTDREAQKYRAYNRKKLEAASRKHPQYSVFKKQVCTYKKNRFLFIGF